MNIDKLLKLGKYKNDLGRIQGSLSGHDLTLPGITNYRRCGISHEDGNPKPDIMFCSHFGKDT